MVFDNPIVRWLATRRLTSVSHLGWPSRAMRLGLGGLGLNRTSP